MSTHPEHSAPRERAAMPTDLHYMPPAPAGFVACRTMHHKGQTTHLVALDEKGSNGGRPTVCGLTRFDDREEDGRPIPNTAGLPGWGLNGGHSGPNVEQIKCAGCYAVADPNERADSKGKGQ